MELVLQSLLTALKHPLVQAVQLQACLVLLIGTIGWSLSGLRRRKEAQRLTAAGYAAALQEAGLSDIAAAAAALPQHCTGVQQAAAAALPPAQASVRQQQQHCMNGSSSGTHSYGNSNGYPVSSSSGILTRRHPASATKPQTTPQQQQAAAAQPASSIFKSRPACSNSSSAPWPALAVVLPVKGCREHSLENWTTQLTAHYGGPRVLLFAVQSDDDPVVAALTELLTQQQQRQRRCNGAIGKQHLKQQHKHAVRQQQQRDCTAPQQQQQQQQRAVILAEWDTGPGQKVLLVNAGLTNTCSQKIHNILAGIEVALAVLQQQQQQHHTAMNRSDSFPTDTPSSTTEANVTAAAAATGSTMSLSWDGSTAAAAACNSAAAAAAAGYVCILDDDVMLHPLSFCQMVDELEADKSLYMVTGYPFDIVARLDSSNGSDSSSSSHRFWGHLLAYAAASYHLPLSIGFSIADRGTFVWGGAMMLRAAELQQAAAAAAAAAAKSEVCTTALRSLEQPNNILQVWRQGGYSDDLLLAGYCAANGLGIGLPASICFPQLLPATYTLKQYWNYLRRQLFVLDTYYSSRDCALNHAMMLLHSYGSAMFSAAMATAAVQCVLLLLLLGAGCVHVLLLLLMNAAAAAGNDTWGTSIIISSAVLRGATGVENRLQAFFALGDPAAAAATGMTGFGPLVAAWRFCIHYTSVSTWLFFGSVITSLMAIGFMIQQVLQLFRVLSPHAGSEVLAPHISLVLLWLGWVVENMMLPYCMLYTFVCHHIVWGGIKYYKQHGKVTQVVHMHT